MLAKDVMTQDVITVDPDDTILRAIRLMLQNGISGLPVSDADGNVVGIVTEGDFLRRTETGTEHRPPRWIEIFMDPGTVATQYMHANARKVRDVMTHAVHSVPEDASLEAIVRLMQKHGIKRLPVLRDGRLVGIVGRDDIMRAVAQTALQAAQTLPSQADAQIRQQLLDHLEKQSWAPTRTIHVTVERGIVTFSGPIYDERARDALRVAAENTPGVVRVLDEMEGTNPSVGYPLPPG